MRETLQLFIASARQLAIKNGLTWDISFDASGKIQAEERWNLSRIAKATTPVYLSDFGMPENLLGARDTLQNKEREAQPEIMLEPWRDYLKALAIDLVLIRQQSAHGFYRLARMTKVLALASGNHRPDELNAERVRLAYNIALLTGDHELARTYPGFLSSRVDDLHIAARPNLRGECIPFTREDTLAAQKRVDASNTISNTWKSRHKSSILTELHERKDELKLPDTAAFWELTRIVFTEQPRSVYDLQIFAACRGHIVTGMRATEIALLPRDWETWHEWFDHEGKSAGEKGGIAKSLQIKHFAAKQNSAAKQEETRTLVPRLHDVPEIFSDIVLQSFHEVEIANRPMREMLMEQYEKGRLFPHLPEQSLIPATELFVRLYGRMEISSSKTPEHLVSAYRNGVLSDDGTVEINRFDPTLLQEIEDHHNAYLASCTDDCGDHFIRGIDLIKAATLYWSDNRSKIKSDFFLNSNGRHVGKVRGRNWGDTYLRVSEVEAVLRENGWNDRILAPALPIAGGKSMMPYDFLFLTGIDQLGSRSEEKVFDVRKFFAVRRFNTNEVSDAIGEKKKFQHLTVFARYGRDDDARKMSCNPHAIRHLQNTDLFRRGVADTVIAKRYNRVNPQQSAVYDHRSLLEKLSHIDVPVEVASYLNQKATLTYKLIASGSVSGPLVDQFRAIQKVEGDQAAFEFLMAEADGLHATPYGFCLNSFTVDPCPNHLECFNDCTHLGRTDFPEEQERLCALRERTAAIVKKIEASPGNTIGRENQLKHGWKRLAGIEKAINTQPGQQVFPDGQDLSRPISQTKGKSIFDVDVPTFSPISKRKPENG